MANYLQNLFFSIRKFTAKTKMKLFASCSLILQPQLKYSQTIIKGKIRSFYFRGRCDNDVTPHVLQRFRGARLLNPPSRECSQTASPRLDTVELARSADSQDRGAVLEVGESVEYGTRVLVVDKAERIHLVVLREGDELQVSCAHHLTVHAELSTSPASKPHLNHRPPRAVPADILWRGRP